jgi:hypothetical protein
MFLFACKKDISTTTAPPIEEEFATGFAPGSGNGGNSCYDYYALLPLADGTFTGYVENVPIQISNVRFQAYDNYGNPITYQDGDPFLGQMNITSSTPAEMRYNSTNPQDDQFVMRIYQMGISIIDISAYQSALTTYFNGQPPIDTNTNVATYLFAPAMPKMTSYTTTIGSLGYHDVAGRLIRINPVQVQSGTNAFGNPTFVTTTFALAPACYPRAGIRAGTTAASVSPRNAYGCTVPSSVDFMRNGMTYRTIGFPTTSITTGAAVSVPANNYALQFNIPAGYPFLSFTMGSRYWESTGSAGSSRIFVTDSVAFVAGTSYTIIESTIEQ